MAKIALLGAGGKMGVRLSANLKGSRFDVDHVEISEAGRARLKRELGVECVEPGQAISSADAVIMAVPDRLIGKVLKSFVTSLRPGARVIMLDAAAPNAGELPEREDITYFVTHPCHPPLFNDETDPKARTDFFGGVSAKQHIVCALMQGPESHYAECEEIAREMYKPVMRACAPIGAPSSSSRFSSRRFPKRWGRRSRWRSARPPTRPFGAAFRNRRRSTSSLAT